MPIHTLRSMRTPVARAMRAAQIGWVATSAVDAATVVNVNDGIQVAKCRPKNTPASTVSRTSRFVSAPREPLRRSPTHTPVRPLPIRHRQKAMASAGAAVAAIIGPLSEMKTTAIPSRAISGAGGRASPEP
jgi:hypothetical protein